MSDDFNVVDIAPHLKNKKKQHEPEKLTQEQYEQLAGKLVLLQKEMHLLINGYFQWINEFPELNIQHTRLLHFVKLLQASEFVSYEKNPVKIAKIIIPNLLKKRRNEYYEIIFIAFFIFISILTFIYCLSII